ncbi:hypothetical protein [Rahnella woolbedingensis]|uniref:Uncharacterized protein n=1 Tax=Rahnella woolbedingensis TaxID=1510574 RepID=A0A419NB02_9GAMM|nr:hypothetical protein [Rahnella woolbedingensis]RJT45064.1 hypothetical protein D6C13_08210 [Rahnella woolbedingensis]
MKKITIIVLASLGFPYYANAEKPSDGLYYSYWNYKSDGKIKEYSVLKNKPEKVSNKYILSKPGKYGGDDEIYIDIKNGAPTLYYSHANNESQSITRGWADARFVDNEIIISASTIITTSIKDDMKISKDNFVGDQFPGKKIPLERNEIVPFETINSNSFKVDCNKYLDINNYRGGDIPDYNESISGDKNLRQSYGGTVFINGEQLCALFLDDDIAPEIKNGWISFKKIN